MSERTGVRAPAYADVQRALERESLTTTPAECHGLLCGMFCAPEDTDEAAWLAEVCADAAARPELIGVLRELREETVRQLFGSQFEFTPLLPSDDAPLALRSRALGSWCEGFLFGLGLGGLHSGEQLLDDAREIMADLAELTRIEPEPEPDAAAEDAYAELVEYVRAGVMLLNEELHRRAFPHSDSVH
jgi:yecA family protein